MRGGRGGQVIYKGVCCFLLWFFFFLFFPLLLAPFARLKTTQQHTRPTRLYPKKKKAQIRTRAAPPAPLAPSPGERPVAPSHRGPEGGAPTPCHTGSRGSHGDPQLGGCLPAVPPTGLSCSSTRCSRHRRPRPLRPPLPRLPRPPPPAPSPPRPPSPRCSRSRPKTPLLRLGGRGAEVEGPSWGCSPIPRQALPAALTAVGAAVATGARQLGPVLIHAPALAAARLALCPPVVAVLIAAGNEGACREAMAPHPPQTRAVPKPPRELSILIPARLCGALLGERALGCSTHPAFFWSLLGSGSSPAP